MPVVSMAPFLLMLAAVAVLPLLSHRFWNSNRNKLNVSLALGLPTAIYLLLAGFGSALYSALVFDYVPFIILLGALCVITGGIFVDTKVGASPAANTALLAIGCGLASLLGTTGAAMLLIRPLLHMNRHRQFKVHTMLFFIATVCNSGGLLTPLGDPPLFMMYLRGVPFAWFLNLLPLWFAVNGAVLALYWFVECRCWRHETDEARTRSRFSALQITLQGKLNFLWLAGVVLAIALVNGKTIPALTANRALGFAREGIVLLMLFFSLYFTPHITRVSNGFTWHPLHEVAAIFLGIFITMVPCLVYLEDHADALGLTSPAAFYYATGTLSSFLDNTPTAVAFYALAQGLGLQTPPLVAGISEVLMRAICAGAVFFGAMTYIGNGPNFMVKTIAEHQNIHMPHFFAYMFKFSLIVLLPIFVLAQLLMF